MQAIRNSLKTIRKNVRGGQRSMWRMHTLKPTQHINMNQYITRTYTTGTEESEKVLTEAALEYVRNHAPINLKDGEILAEEFIQHLKKTNVEKIAEMPQETPEEIVNKWMELRKVLKTTADIAGATYKMNDMEVKKWLGKFSNVNDNIKEKVEELYEHISTAIFNQKYERVISDQRALGIFYMAHQAAMSELVKQYPEFETYKLSEMREAYDNLSKSDQSFDAFIFQAIMKEEQKLLRKEQEEQNEYRESIKEEIEESTNEELKEELKKLVQPVNDLDSIPSWIQYKLQFSMAFYQHA